MDLAFDDNYFTFSDLLRATDFTLFAGNLFHVALGDSYGGDANKPDPDLK